MKRYGRLIGLLLESEDKNRDHEPIEKRLVRRCKSLFSADAELESTSKIEVIHNLDQEDGTGTVPLYLSFRQYSNELLQWLQSLIPTEWTSHSNLSYKLKSANIGFSIHKRKHFIYAMIHFSTHFDLSIGYARTDGRYNEGRVSFEFYVRRKLKDWSIFRPSTTKMQRCCLVDSIFWFREKSKLVTSETLQYLLALHLSLIFPNCCLIPFNIALSNLPESLKTVMSHLAVCPETLIRSYPKFFEIYYTKKSALEVRSRLAVYKTNPDETSDSRICCIECCPKEVSAVHGFCLTDAYLFEKYDLFHTPYPC